MKSRLHHITLLALLCVPLFAMAQRIDRGELQSCDLLFVVNTRGNAITASTTPLGQLPTDHVAVALCRGDSACVYESVPGSGVGHTTLLQFLQRCHDEGTAVVAARPAGIDRSATISRLTSISAPYDSLYLPGNDAIYCSELVQLAFVDSLGHEVFESIPMSFHDGSGAILPYWTELYRRHGMPVPEGKPGTNPGQLLRHKLVRILGWLQQQ